MFLLPIYRKKKKDIVEVHFYARLISEGSSDTWYIAICEGKNDDGTYKMEYLIRIQDGNNLKSKHPLGRDCKWGMECF